MSQVQQELQDGHAENCSSEISHQSKKYYCKLPVMSFELSGETLQLFSVWQSLLPAVLSEGPHGEVPQVAW